MRRFPRYHPSCENLKVPHLVVVWLVGTTHPCLLGWTNLVAVFLQPATRGRVRRTPAGPELAPSPSRSGRLFAYSSLSTWERIETLASQSLLEQPVARLNRPGDLICRYMRPGRLSGERERRSAVAVCFNAKPPNPSPASDDLARRRLSSPNRRV